MHTDPNAVSIPRAFISWNIKKIMFQLLNDLVHTFRNSHYMVKNGSLKTFRQKHLLQNTLFCVPQQKEKVIQV